MNSRLQALVDRGYSKEEVLKLASFTNEEVKYAIEKTFEHLSNGCSKVDNPTIIYIGGQPGSGKSVLSMELKNSFPNYIELGIDNYRMYHPRYLEIEKCIKKHWENKKETINDSPGNDIADFTHLFAGTVADGVTELSSSLDNDGKSYNILMEWGMREPNGPLNSMKDLKEKGYTNIVLFLGVNKEDSYKACNLRADIMKNFKRIFRKVPKNFHDICINTLPDSIEKIYNEGYKYSFIDYMAIISRDSRILWDVASKENPKDVYNSCINNISDINNNDLFKALAINNKELIGMINDKEKLEQIRDNVIVFTPNLEVLNKNNVK